MARLNIGAFFPEGESYLTIKDGGKNTKYRIGEHEISAYLCGDEEGVPLDISLEVELCPVDEKGKEIGDSKVMSFALDGKIDEFSILDLSQLIGVIKSAIDDYRHKSILKKTT